MHPYGNAHASFFLRPCSYPDDGYCGPLPADLRADGRGGGHDGGHGAACARRHCGFCGAHAHPGFHDWRAPDDARRVWHRPGGALAPARSPNASRCDHKGASGRLPGHLAPLARLHQRPSARKARQQHMAAVRLSTALERRQPRRLHLAAGLGFRPQPAVATGNAQRTRPRLSSCRAPTRARCAGADVHPLDERRPGALHRRGCPLIQRSQRRGGGGGANVALYAQPAERLSCTVGDHDPVSVHFAVMYETRRQAIFLRPIRGYR